MRITNKFNLPQPIVNAVINDPYDNGGADLTVTQLIKPPRMVALEKMHYDEIVEDASDRIWSLFGQAIHTILERAGDDDGVEYERRFHAGVSGLHISGQADVIDHNKHIIQDYKVTSVWSVINGPKTEWEQQLNILAWLSQNYDYKLQIVAILRDHSKTRVAMERGYPQENITVIAVNNWGKERQEEFVKERVWLHQAALQAADNGEPLPLCSDEERWADPDKWAIRMKHQKRAKKLFDSKESALLWAEANGFADADEDGKINLRQNVILEKRQGNPIKRCDPYCHVRAFCSQYATLKSIMEGKNEFQKVSCRRDHIRS